MGMCLKIHTSIFVCLCKDEAQKGQQSFTSNPGRPQESREIFC